MTLTDFRRVLAREYDNRYGCAPAGTTWLREPWIRPFLRGITPVVTARTQTMPLLPARPLTVGEA